jgi:trehalose 6-phosphate synthase/phosphatase
LLDYDGTLVRHLEDAGKAYPSYELIEVLTRLINRPQTKVVIITGRSQNDIEKFVGHLPIDIIAEHGAIFKENNVWGTLGIETAFWKNRMSPILYNITLQCPESSIEEKDCSLTWHYRKSDPELGYSCSRKLIGTLNQLIGHYDLKIIDGNKVVEIMSSDIGKGKAVKNLVEKKKYNYILSIGDDRTDEEMFEFLLPYKNATTIKVGTGETSAKYRLDNVECVMLFLERVSKIDSI